MESSSLRRNFRCSTKTQKVAMRLGLLDTQEEPEKYSELILRNDAEGIMRELTKPVVEDVRLCRLVMFAKPILTICKCSREFVGESS